MFTSRKFRHLLAVTTALSVATPMLAAAQTDDSGAPPPSRVAAIASFTGSVSFNGAGSNGQWVAASQNYPVTDNDSVFTQSGAQATVTVDSTRLVLAENTELQITQLDQSTLAATESQGEMFLGVSYLQQGQSFAITTPRGTVTITENGNYDIAVGDQNNPTIVDVFDGAATVTDPGATLQISAGQSGVLTGTDQTTAQLGTAEQDSFVSGIMSQATNAAAPPPSYCAPVVQHMTGVTQLASYGSWSQSSSYGAVWYPTVSAGWAPYREGHWAYVQPWGYTWVDDEPWGFAPFHYGRWFQDGDRWGWAPTPVYEPSYYGSDYAPVYAPALVSFFGAGVGVGISVGFGGGFGGGGVGWVPLGPNEPYYPSYGYGGNTDYFRRINYGGVHYTNINNSIHNTTIINNYNNYSNRRGATYIDKDAMSRGEAVNRFGKPVPEDALAKAQPIDFRRGAGPQGAMGGQHADALPQPHFAPRVASAPHPTAFGARHDLPPAVVSHEPAPNIRPGEAYAGPHGGAIGAPAAERPGQPGNPGFANKPGFANNPGFHPPPSPPGGAFHPGAAGGEMAHPDNINTPNAPHPGEMTAPHPGFANNPGFRPPPAPPGGDDHPGAPAGDVSHPGFAPQHPQAPAYHSEPGINHPEAPAYHSEAPAYHPEAPAYHPEAPAYHPAQPAYHPEAPAYHPPAPAYHPEQPAYHPPAPAYHPEAQMPRPEAMQPTHVDVPRPEAPRPEPAPHRDEKHNQ